RWLDGSMARWLDGSMATGGYSKQYPLQAEATRAKEAQQALGGGAPSVQKTTTGSWNRETSLGVELLLWLIQRRQMKRRLGVISSPTIPRPPSGGGTRSRPRRCPR